MLNSTTWTVSPASERLIGPQRTSSVWWSLTCLARWFWQSRVFFRSSSIGAGAAVWEGASLVGGAEDTTKAAAGGAEGGADLQTHCSQRGGRASNLKNLISYSCSATMLASQDEIYLPSICCRGSLVISKTAMDKGVNDDLESEHLKGDFVTVFWTF